MKNMRLIATALAALAASPAHAEGRGPTGRWLDAAHHIDLSDLPDNSEAIGRLNYAKEACNPGRPYPPRPGYDGCMRSYGFKFVPDTPAQIAAKEAERKEAAAAQQRAEMGAIIANGLNNLAQDVHRQLNPPRCNGSIYPGGNFNMTCY
jgi:hypothetical protein